MSTLQTDANAAGAPRPPPRPPQPLPQRFIPNRLQNESEKISNNKGNVSPELRTSEQAIDGEVKQRPEQSRLAQARRAAEEQAQRSGFKPKNRPMPHENGVGATSRLHAARNAEQVTDDKVKQLTKNAKLEGAQRAAAQKARRLQTERDQLSGIKLYKKRPQDNGAVALKSTQVPVKRSKTETSEAGTSKSFAARQTVAVPPQSCSLPLTEITNDSRDAETHGVQIYVGSGANVCNSDHERIIAELRSEVDRLNHELNASKSEVDRLNHELDALKARHDEKMRRFGDQVAILSLMISSPETGDDDDKDAEDVGDGGEEGKGGDDAGRGRAGGDGEEEDKGGDAAQDDVLNSRQRGSTRLKYVERACGEVAAHPGNMLVTMQDAFAGMDSAAATIAALRDGSTVQGVMMGQIMAEVFARVGMKRLNQEQFVEWLISDAPAFRSAQVDRESRIFRLDGTKYSSPLTELQSGFARRPCSLLHAAAGALQASDDELNLALREFTSTSMTRGAFRMHQARAVYYYQLRIVVGNAETQEKDKANKTIQMVYVGESTDVETRINTHIDHILEPVDETTGVTHQMGHRMARAAIAGADSPSAVELEAWCLIALDKDSALLLAKSYVDFCRRQSKNVPSTSAGIMEVCRIIGAVGFIQEAFYTVLYNSLFSQSTDERRGMNFSQPGIIHTSSTSTFDQLPPLKEHWDLVMQAREQRQERPRTSGSPGAPEGGRENLRHFVRIALPEEGRDIRYVRWSDEEGVDTVFYAVRSGDAPGAEPRVIPGDTPVEITMTPDGEGGRSEHARVSLDKIDLTKPYGIITHRRFDLDVVKVNGENILAPVRREFFSVWIRDPPPERVYLDPTNKDDIQRPSAENLNEVCTFLCANSAQAWTAARARCKFFNEAVGLPAESKEGAYPVGKKHKETGQGYLLVTLNSSGRVGKAASARLYYDQPPELDMVYHVRCKLNKKEKPTPNRQDTHAVAVERTYKQAHQAALKHRQSPIVWKTTVREAMAYCTSRRSEVKNSFWRPPPGGR